jgi:hypothetical protein
MKIRVDANKKKIATQIAVTIPKNAKLLGLIMSGDRALHALVQIGNRFYSLCGSALRSLPTIEIDWVDSNDNVECKQKHPERDYLGPYFRLE